MRLLLSLIFLFPLLVYGQSTVSLTALYSFESNLGDATGDATNLGQQVGAVDYDCGVSGQALLLTAPGDYVRIPGGGSNNVNRVFDDEDFTLSLYFKSTEASGQRALLTKRDTVCTNPAYLWVGYDNASRTVFANLEAGANTVTLTHQIVNSACWQHLAIAREGSEFRLFVNGIRVGATSSAVRTNIDNEGELLIGASPCPATDGETFRGLIDEVRVYSRALSDAEVADLYVFPDRILNPPTQLFLGQSVDVDLNSNCGTTFSWNPTAGVVSPTEAEPTITPTQAGRRVYTVTIGEDQTNCLSQDTLVLNVVDPNDLDCSQLFVPKAFTPNGIGPAQNETFGVANPFAVPNLTSFEVYDRNGALVFRTNDAFTRWDGNFKGKPVNPGAMLWRAVYVCRDQEIVTSGSVVILR